MDKLENELRRHDDKIDELEDGMDKLEDELGVTTTTVSILDALRLIPVFLGMARTLSSRQNT